jgi:hypothetical protein
VDGRGSRPRAVLFEGPPGARAGLRGVRRNMHCRNSMCVMFLTCHTPKTNHQPPTDQPPTDSQGTGKTTSARVLSTQAAVPLVYIPLEALMSKCVRAECVCDEYVCVLRV